MLKTSVESLVISGAGDGKLAALTLMFSDGTEIVVHRPRVSTPQVNSLVLSPDILGKYAIPHVEALERAVTALKPLWAKTTRHKVQKNGCCAKDFVPNSGSCG